MPDEVVTPQSAAENEGASMSSFLFMQYLRDFSDILDALNAKYGIKPGTTVVTPVNSVQQAECTRLKQAVYAKCTPVLSTVAPMLEPPIDPYVPDAPSGDEDGDGPVDDGEGEHIDG